MRGTTAAQIKGSATRRTCGLPREGSQSRKVYDLLYAQRGLPVDVNMYEIAPPRAITDLTDFYGCDIRRLSNGSSKRGRKSQWLLAGEWFGRVYIDYVAERLEKATLQ